jgi:hypothetical protein
MNTDLEIQEIIKKNLPQQVGDVLKVRLEQAEKDANLVVQLKNKISQLEESVKKQLDLLDEYELLDRRNSKLDEREVLLNKKQHDLDLEILQQKFENEKDKSDFAKSLALGLVRNTEFRKSVYDTENQAGYSSGTNWIQPTPIHKSLTETETVI